MTIEEIIAAQQAARAFAEQTQKAAQDVNTKMLRSQNPGVTTATPAKGWTSAIPATSFTPFTQASGLPPTAQVTSVGYEPTSSAGGGGGTSGGGGGLSGGSSGAAYSGGGGEGEGGGGGGLVVGGAEAAAAAAAAAKTAAVSNPLTQERPLNPVQASAQAYRDLPANASPEAKAVARAQYANALNESAKEQPARSASEAFGAPPPRQPSPEQQAKEQAGIANYNAYLERQGINPHEIGTAQMNTRGGLDVMSIPEEREAKYAANQAAEEMQGYITAEREAKTKARHLKGSEKDAAEQNVLQIKREKNKFGIQSGLINPKNPKAGMDMDNAERMARANQRLLRDPSSLAGLAQQRIQQQPSSEATAKKATEEQQKAQPKEITQAERQALEMAQITARNQAAAQQWYDDLLRRQQATFGQNQYIYNG